MKWEGLTKRQVEYRAYLKSPEWKAVRGEAVARDGGKCVECGRDETLQAHHERYPENCWETVASDLVTLCIRCHRKRHGFAALPGARADWVKLHGSILASSIWTVSPKETRLVWVVLLVLADYQGNVFAPAVELAEKSGVTLEECLAAVEELKAPDKWSRSQAREGRRIEEVGGGWRVLNYSRYRYGSKGGKNVWKDLRNNV